MSQTGAWVRSLALLGLLVLPASAQDQPKPPAKKKPDPAAKKKPTKKADEPAKKADKKADKKKNKKKKRTRPPGPPVVIFNARVAGFPGKVGIMVMGGKIRGISPRLRPQRGMKGIDAGGGRVVAGRIDAWASLGNPDKRGNALDAFDPYDSYTIRQALRNGITTVFINPMRSGAISGTGAVIKLFPDTNDLEVMVVKEEVAVCTSLIGLSPSSGVGLYDKLRKTFQGAERYRDAWLDYKEELEKYVKALPKPKKDGKKKPGAKKPGKKPGKQPGKKPVKKPTPPKKPPPKKNFFFSGCCVDPEHDHEVQPRPPRRPRRPMPKKPAKPTGKKDAKKKTGPKKPKQPKIDRAMALVVRVLDGELPVRLEAHRVEDIISALDLQKEFGFKLIIEGATEGHLLAKVLAKRKITVVLGPQRQSSLVSDRFPMRHRADNARILSDAGVKVVIGSDSWSSGRSLDLQAALAVNAGLPAAKGEQAITSEAAKLLGLEERLGKVAPRFDADLVVLSPSSLGAEVPIVVLVDGHIVYRSGKP